MNKFILKNSEKMLEPDGGSYIEPPPFQNRIGDISKTLIMYVKTNTLYTFPTISPSLASLCMLLLFFLNPFYHFHHYFY
ncbi:hypothetical protein SAMN05421676_10586 [Salinibacillus kushneri]|uniref:Uncharacterized protein n=1 Tax=Salinibacillus kushneri TaxID=237682 RepID=A0A1I0EUE7_9BACI|nr:hypothetical protein SAMN05421676_10586 [Salinibacillus kushneri]